MKKIFETIVYVLATAMLVVVCGWVAVVYSQGIVSLVGDIWGTVITFALAVVTVAYLLKITRKEVDNEQRED